jgi:hypothetical protein
MIRGDMGDRRGRHERTDGDISRATTPSPSRGPGWPRPRRTEPNDPNAIALATVDADGLPNVRMVLLKEIEAAGQGDGAFVFYTNYESAKGAGTRRQRARPPS